MIISFTRDLGAMLISEMGGGDDRANPGTVRTAAYGINTLKGPTVSAEKIPALSTDRQLVVIKPPVGTKGTMVRYGGLRIGWSETLLERTVVISFDRFDADHSIIIWFARLDCAVRSRARGISSQIDYNPLDVGSSQKRGGLAMVSKLSWNENSWTGSSYLSR